MADLEEERKRKVKQLQTILSQNGIDKQQRMDIVLGFTEGVKSSVGELSVEELSQLINVYGSQQRESGDRMRKKAIALLRELGAQEYDPETNRSKADMHRIYRWVKHYGKHNPKGLNSYTHNELVELVSQVQQMHRRELLRQLETLFPGAASPKT